MSNSASALDKLPSREEYLQGARFPKNDDTGIIKRQRAHELAMHAAYKACGQAKDIADAYNTAYKIVMEANHG